jgi:L-ascorbate metabolism protein UlaG (beta-lactamase superfamily)
MQLSAKDLHENAKITFVGHATTLTEMSGVRILTDPLFRNNFRLLKRRSQLCTTSIGLDSIDAVVLSHMHFDHMDYPSLRMIPSHVPIIAPEGAGRYLKKKVAHDIVEMREGDSVRVGDVDIHATPSVHESGFYWPMWLSKKVLSYVFVGSRTVFFVGDTALFEDLADIGKSFNIDTAMLPVWGFGPYIRGDHMSPAEAAEALSMLSARTAIPIHWGTVHPIGPIWEKMSFLEEPPRVFSREAARIVPMTDVRILSPGESTVVGAPSADKVYLRELGIESALTVSA